MDMIGGKMMKVLRKFIDECSCCMEEHEIWVVEEEEKTRFKNEDIVFYPAYYYCKQMDEYYEDEKLMKSNQLKLIDRYREMKNLLTSKEIIHIREIYDISQKDLSKLLGWSPATITRYENYQIQEKAYDEILRKLSIDPQWFIDLLYKAEEQFSPALYKKYYQNAKCLLNEQISIDTQNKILLTYQTISIEKYCVNKQIDFNKITDVINYICQKVSDLYKVKLMKLLWYCDSLSYKRYHYSITGLAYQAESMGALPVCHNEMMLLPDICFEEIEFDAGYGYKFYEKENYQYHLSKEEKDVIDHVLDVCGQLSREEIVEKMHQEDAYRLTQLQSLIDYHLGLSIKVCK